MTLVGTNFFYRNITNNTVEFYKNGPISLFNGELMINLSIFYRNFIIPFYNQIKIINVESVNNYLDGIKLLFICIFASYLTFIVFLFFFFLDSLY